MMNNSKPRIFMKIEKPSSNTSCDFESIFPIQLYTFYRIYVTSQSYDLIEVVFDNTYNTKENLCTQLDIKKCTHTKKKVIKVCVWHKFIYLWLVFSYDHVLDLIILAALFDITDLFTTTVMFTSIFFRIMANKNLKNENKGVRLYIKNYK